MKPELVVPAGDFDALRAAVANGADAVYLGGKRFNARIHAKNFGLEELGQVIRYAHNLNVKVYVTVNTLIADRELSDLDNYLANLYSLEADAVIVQDLGVLKLCRELHPNLRVHASTQATISSSAGVKFWVDHGARRAILARELSLEQIRRVKEECGVELEVFAHGALCFAYSGQCLLSGFIGGRSANRGRCASPCRLPYSIVVGENGTPLCTDGSHLLSMKDLNLSEDIGRLAEAGVDALKIEGRMKIPEYVAVVTGIYRRLIDDCYREPTPMEKRDLESIFNREFTKGCLYNSPGSGAINRDRPGNYGTEVGVVTGYSASSKTSSIRLFEDTRVGDGLEFQTALGREGLIVKKMFVDGRGCTKAPARTVAEIVLPFQPLLNSPVLKSRDSALHERARATFSQPNGFASARSNQLHYSRQNGDERLSSVLLTPRKNDKTERIRKIPKICVEVIKLQALREAVNAGADEVYFGGFPESTLQLDLNNYRQALDLAKENKVPITIVLPRAASADVTLEDWMLKLREAGADTFLVGDVGALEVARQMGVKMYLDSSLNVFNRLTRNQLFDYSARITVSQELHMSQIARIAGGAAGEVECIVHGPLTLMLSRYCPASNAVNRGDKTSCREACCKKGFLLKDQKGMQYPVKCDEVSNTHIISSKDICLIEHMPELKTAGIDVFRLRCHLYSPSAAAELVNIYRTSLNIDNEKRDAEVLSSLKKKILNLSEREITEGKLLTGVE